MKTQLRPGNHLHASGFQNKSNNQGFQEQFRPDSQRFEREKDFAQIVNNTPRWAECEHFISQIVKLFYFLYLNFLIW